MIGIGIYLVQPFKLLNFYLIPIKYTDSIFSSSRKFILLKAFGVRLDPLSTGLNVILNNYSNLLRTSCKNLCLVNEIIIRFWLTERQSSEGFNSKSRRESRLKKAWRNSNSPGFFIKSQQTNNLNISHFLHINFVWIPIEGIRACAFDWLLLPFQIWI